jgi:hypothetical protein
MRNELNKLVAGIDDPVARKVSNRDTQGLLIIMF